MNNKIFLSVTVPLLVGLIGFATLLIFMFVRVNSLDSKLDRAETKIELLQNNQQGQAGHVAVDPLGEKVYIPELKIRLPFTSLAKTFTYSTRTDKDGGSVIEADVSSDLYTYPDRMLVKNCGNLVRLKIEDKQNPYNPHEKPTTVNLVDGRKLQVYEFVNEKSCNDSWSASISPEPVANAFKGAESY